MMAFTSQLFYFTIKVLVCFILIKYKNQLWENKAELVVFISLLLLNTYFIITTGNNPGYENKVDHCED